MKRTSVLVYVSELAAATCVHPYQKPHEVFEKVWRRCDPEGFEEAFRARRMVTDEQRLELLVHDSADVQAIVSDSVEARPMSSRDTLDTATRLLRRVKLEDPGDAKLIENVVRRTVFADYGTRSEDTVFEALKKELFFDIQKDERFRKKIIGKHPRSGTSYGFGGRVDAMSVDGATVVEIKNRVRGLFGRVVEYERVQVLGYIDLTGADSGLLAEAYTLPTGNVSIDTHPVSSDPGELDRIFDRLREFCELLIDVMTDPAVRDAYLGQKRRSAMIRKRVIISAER